MLLAARSHITQNAVGADDVVEIHDNAQARHKFWSIDTATRDTGDEFL
jgi:hypothetical protein